MCPRQRAYKCASTNEAINAPPSARLPISNCMAFMFESDLLLRLEKRVVLALLPCAHFLRTL